MVKTFPFPRNHWNRMKWWCTECVEFIKKRESNKFDAMKWMRSGECGLMWGILEKVFAFSLVLQKEEEGWYPARRPRPQEDEDENDEINYGSTYCKYFPRSTLTINRTRESRSLKIDDAALSRTRKGNDILHGGWDGYVEWTVEWSNSLCIVFILKMSEMKLNGRAVPWFHLLSSSELETRAKREAINISLGDWQQHNGMRPWWW